MKKLLLYIVLLWQSVPAVAQPADSYLKNILTAWHMPGASMVIVKDGQWLYNRSFGHANIVSNTPMDRQKLFLLSSASGVVVATAVMQLWEKGVLNLDIDASSYLPFQLMHPYHNNDSITVRMLLTHTASIDDNINGLANLTGQGDCPVSLDSLVRNYFEQGGVYYSATKNFTTDKPGVQWHFSNMSMVLAAYIVEQVTGDDFSHYSDTAIFSKLCMKNTAYFLSAIADTNIIARPYSWDGSAYVDNGLYGCPGYPAVMLRSSATAMARFMAMYMAYGQYEGERILDSSTVVQMMQPHPPSLYQGIGFYSRIAGNGDRVWGQDGSMWGTSAAMYFSYSTKTGVLMLLNGEGTNNPMLLMDTLYMYGVSAVPKATDTFPDCDEAMSAGEVRGGDNDITMFPNPASGYLKIRVPHRGQMLLTNMQGQLQAEYLLQSGDNQIVLPPKLAAGLFLAEIRYNNNLYRIKRLVYIN